MTVDEDAGGGNPSYKGYDYQKLVTVWVALTLMFGADSTASEIIVEPASHDDVKARLDVADDEAEASLTVGGGDELHVQIKFKGAGYWSAKDFAAVVTEKKTKGKRGPAQRPRAAALLLADARRRYLFITNTSVDGALAAGRVQTPTDRPDRKFLPTNLALDAPQSTALAGRFALIEHMTPSETRRRIERLLSEQLHVPAQNVDSCIDSLKRLVEDRLLAVPDPLRRTHIEKIAESLGGMPHPNPELACYVAPTNFNDAEDRLTHKGAVLLIGPSGYGKSLTADKLAFERRNADPPFRIVRENLGLSGVEDAFAAPGRVLFHLEDPWGQSGLDDKQTGLWKKSLAALIRQKRPDKQFVITSRTEIFREALGEAPAPVWADRAVVIDGSSYDDAARRSILHSNLASADSWRCDLARQHEGRLLRNLRSPQEISTFTRELKAVGKPGDADVDKLMDRALTDSRTDVVVELVRGLGDRGVRGAAVLWAGLRFSRALHPDRLRLLRRAIDRHAASEIALDDLADHLAHTQLEFDSDGAWVCHAKVAEALESLARAHPRAAEAALNAAAAAACELASSNAEWMDVLLRFVDGARALESKGVALEDEVVDTVDRLLTDALTSSVHEPDRFRAAWRAGSQRLSERTAVGRLVQWLDGGQPRTKKGFDFGWKPPKISGADRAGVLAEDPDLRIARGFVGHILPSTHEDYDAGDLLPWLRSFGRDLTEAFLSAGEEVVRATRFVMSADTISEGALAWPVPPYDNVWDQILRLDAAVDNALACSREQRRQAWQGEVDFAEQLAIEDEAGDEGPSVGNFAKGYVRARRRQEGIGWIPGHPRPDLILPLWAEVMRMSPPAVAPAELDAFFAAVGQDDELQADGLRVIGERRIAAGRGRVLEALKSGGPKSMEAAVRALGWLEAEAKDGNGRSTTENLLLNLIQDLPGPRAAMLAPHIADLEIGKEKAALASRVVEASAPSARPAVHLALARALGADDSELRQRFREMDPAEATALIESGPRKLARLLLVIAAAEGLDVIPLAEQWATSSDVGDALAGVAALSQSRSSGAAASILNALEHSDFQVRRSAIRLLAPVADDGERHRLLAMAGDRSAPVRAALAQAIGEHGWKDGFPTLLVLLGDTRNYTRHPEIQRRDEPDYQVAKAAADAMGRLVPLPVEAVETILKHLDGSRSLIDIELHAKLLGLVATLDDPRIWDLLGRALTDDHVVGEADENLYPLRYAAAWKIVERLAERPSEVDLVPWAQVEAAADHIDPQLAAPALLSLGCRLASAAGAAALQALRRPHASEARTALALSAFEDRAAARDLAVRHALLTERHPLFRNDVDASTDEAAWGRWSISPAGRDWLLSLNAEEDVVAVLLRVMAQRTGLPLAPVDFDPSALRRRSKIPLTTFAEMFGME